MVFDNIANTHLTNLVNCVDGDLFRWRNFQTNTHSQTILFFAEIVKEESLLKTLEE